MPEALDHVAAMTRTRDRSLIDATLVAAFLDMLPVQRALLWRMVGEGVEACWQCSVDQSQGELVAQTGGLRDSAELRPLNTLPSHTQSYHQTEVIHEQADEGFRVLLPMASERETEGVAELLCAQALTPEHLRVAQAVLRIHRNFSSLLDYSERDTLTGLLNRKGFDETFLSVSVREQGASAAALASVDGERRHPGTRRYWLCVVDVDRFKLVNDNFGHLIGDEVLVLVARIMRNSFRYHDRLYRFGGEEFVVLLSAADEEHAAAACERLRRNISEFPFPRVGRVTVSVGYTDVRQGDTPQAAFERADRAVYYVKEHGRNGVAGHAALVRSGALHVEGDNVGDVELF